jgi:CheY-specific phosphatase CheX
MRADVAQPFLLAAKGVLEQKLGGKVGRGQIKMERGDFEAGEITAVVGASRSSTRSPGLGLANWAT